MTLSAQKPQRRTLDDYEARRARHYGLRAVARALGLRDFVELRRPRRTKIGRRARPWIEGTNPPTDLQRPRYSRRTWFAGLSSRNPTKTVWRRRLSSDQLR